jgi:hypothetical protein
MLLIGRGLVEAREQAGKRNRHHRGKITISGVFEFFEGLGNF